MVRYSCPKCEFETIRKSTISDHFGRKRPCRISNDGVELTDDIKQKVLCGSYQKPALRLPDTVPVGNNTTNHTTNNTTNTTNNVNINIVFNPPVPSSTTLQFPRQDLSHLTPEFKRSVMDTVSTSGFQAAVRQMIDVTYFSMSEPHNRNIIMERLQTLVFDKTRQWTKIDTDVAVHHMLEEHGHAIHNFPEDEDLAGLVDEKCVERIDTSFNTDMHLDPALMSALSAHGIRETDRVKLMQTNPLFVKLADMADQERKRLSVKTCQEAP